MEHQLRRLNQHEFDNPDLVFKEFFDYVHLPQCRQKLRDWLHAGLIGAHETGQIDPAGLFLFYERLEKLVEGAYLISKERQE